MDSELTNVVAPVTLASGIAGTVGGILGITDTHGSGATLASASVHGPYEDLGLEALKTLNIVLADCPSNVKQVLWKDWLTWHTGLQVLAGRLDFLHLFTPKPNAQ